MDRLTMGSKSQTAFHCGDEDSLRDDLAACLRLVAYYGWDELVYTHTTVRLSSQSDMFIMNPIDQLFHKIRPDHLVKINLYGELVSPQDGIFSKAGFILHSAIHATRPDALCIMHIHSPVGMALSALKSGLLPICQTACRFYNRIGYHDYEGIFLQDEEKQQLVKDLGDHKAMILRNHGIMTIGETVGEAFTLMHDLIKSAEAQLMIGNLDNTQVIPHDIAEETAKNFESFHKPGVREWSALKELVTLKHNV